MEALDLENLITEMRGAALLSRIDLEKLSVGGDARARRTVATIVQEIIAAQEVPLNGAERGQAETDLLDEVFGLGPLEPLLKDPAVSDILVNNKDVVYVEPFGILERTTARFRDDRHLLQVIDRIVSRVGRRVDESSPMVDARLLDGSRVNAIIPPLALDGLSEALDLLVICVEAGLSIDRATMRAAEEFRFNQPDIADELNLVYLEQRAGRPRSEAWKRAAGRTGVDTIPSLASILIQADKFGTSIGKTLRAHADTLRTQRRQDAEEKAAKTTVKLVFPLVIFIFPSLFVVTLGPAMIIMLDGFAKLLS